MNWKAQDAIWIAERPGSDCTEWVDQDMNGFEVRKLESNLFGHGDPVKLGKDRGDGFLDYCAVFWIS